MGSGKAGGDTQDYPWSPGSHSPPRPVVDLSLESHRRVGWERLDNRPGRGRTARFHGALWNTVCVLKHNCPST